MTSKAKVSDAEMYGYAVGGILAFAAIFGLQILLWYTAHQLSWWAYALATTVGSFVWVVGKELFKR
jgi:hypothetical protein